MKRFVHLSLFLFCALLFSQNESSNGISYQGVARDAQGGILSNQPISVIFRIVDNPQGEGQLYQETHTVTTDSYGLFNLSVGSGEQEQYSYGEIQWGSYDYCGLSVSIDFNNDGVYAEMGVMKMEDVPTAKWANMAGEANYAEYSGNAGLANMASYANNASGDLLDIITDLQEQVAILQWNNNNNEELESLIFNNTELLQTIETQSALITQLQNQINDLYNALGWAMPQINGLTIDNVIIYSGGDLDNFDNINNINLD